jgi:hypothetical protein
MTNSTILATVIAAKNLHWTNSHRKVDEKKRDPQPANMSKEMARNAAMSLSFSRRTENQPREGQGAINCRYNKSA